MKLDRFSRITICLLLLMLTGCHQSTKPIFKVPPVPQASYVDEGGIIQWYPAGKPFQIYWLNNQSPCFPTDNPTSDGTQIVTCHAFIAGSYNYDIDKPAKQGSSKVESQTHTGMFSMHVGSCTGCSGVPPQVLNAPPQDRNVVPRAMKPSPEARAGKSSLNTSSSDEVDISCAAANDPTAVNPPAGPSGLKVGDYVPFYFKGKYVQGFAPMSLTFSPADCSNNPNPGRPFVVTGSSGSGYCQVATTPTIRYTAESNQCTKVEATLSVSTSQ